MTNTANTVLSLSHEEAMDFFMKSDNYHSFELPEYFVFDDMLQSVKTIVADKPYDQCLQPGVSPEELPEVNLDILLNKDGRYAVRPLILANPFLYYFVVRELCSEQAWAKVRELFAKFQVPCITACALPVLPKEVEAFHKSSTILNWWASIEQRSIELSLEYRYMFVTDITNCYGSVNPQTIDWAFALKDTKHATTGSPIAANLKRYLRALQHGRNIGIPQGSTAFDFIAEIVLGYSDLLLHEAIDAAGITAPYEIIRYRDDYRIFCNDRDALEQISYILQHVLESLNFRMNSKKTKISESIVTDAIKPDKLDYIYNTPIYNKKGVDFDSFEKHLLYILLFARKHPNSGTVRTLLSDIDKRIAKRLKADDGKLVGGSVKAMAAVCVQIAIENVNSSHYALRVISRMVDSLDDASDRLDIISSVCRKLSSQPNSTYTQLWLQNMTYRHDLDTGSSPYDVRLCKVVMGDDVALCDNTWLADSLTAAFDQSAIVDSDTLAQVTPIITFRETRIYNAAYPGGDDPDDIPDGKPRFIPIDIIEL